MSTFSYAPADSTTMLRRNLRRSLRYPVAPAVSVGVPIVLLLLFVFVFGDTMGAGLPGASGGRGAYLDFVTPGIVLIAVAGAAQAVAIAVAIVVVLGAAPFLGSGFVPTDTMPAGIRWFAEHQPFTPIMDTLRGLLMGTSIGDSAVIAIAWSVGIALVGYLWARRLFDRDPAPAR